MGKGYTFYHEWVQKSISETEPKEDKIPRQKARGRT